MEQHSIIEELLALRQEVQSLKFLNGGAISDLVSRVNALERTGVKMPDYAKTQTLINLRDTIVPDWDVDTKPLDTIYAPSDGYLLIVAQTKSYDNSSDTSLVAKRVTVFVNSHIVCDAIAALNSSSGKIDGSDCNSVIVNSGDKISYGSQSGTPNGFRSFLLIKFVPFKG